MYILKPLFEETRFSLLAVIEQDLAMADVRLEDARERELQHRKRVRRFRSESDRGAARALLIQYHQTIELFEIAFETLVRARKRALDTWR